MNKLNWWSTSAILLLLCAATAIALPAQTFIRAHSFDGADGRYPHAALVQATDGNLYGTTEFGGAGGYGTVFRITPSGTLTTLYSFCPQTGCMDGENPYAGLVQATNGNLYGTTYGGGANGGGTIFKVTESGTLTTLYSFCSQTGCTDGENPYAGLVQATNGNLYGTTWGGGTNGRGTLFKITPSDTLTTLYSFCSQSCCTDGENPYAGLVQATNGNLYGTTYGGGANGGGTIFKVTESGMLTTLYGFCSQSGCTDGENPNVGLVQATDGSFYGATFNGGLSGAGTVFKVTSSGAVTTFYSFCSQSGCTDGSEPDGALVEATNGNLYGTTSYLGASGDQGTAFEITLSGTLTTLYSFCSQRRCADGAGPVATLVQDTNGNFYGTTGAGGDNNDGTVFSLSVGLGPFVETLPAGGKVGAPIKILGSDLTGATSVTFNGTPTTFTVEASSVIKATVPAAATTGTVQVVTPSGTLSSNVPFRVAP